MASLWPWLAVAGVGALHGLNPATGWLPRRSLACARAISGCSCCARCCRSASATRRRDRARRRCGGARPGAGSRRVASGGRRAVARRGVGSSLAPRCATRAAPAGHAGLALWSFMTSTAHGAGLMLVPALIPICFGDAPARQITAWGSLLPALAAVALHGAAMLAVTGAIAAGVCCGVGAMRRSRYDDVRRPRRGCPGRRAPPPAPTSMA